MKTVNYLVLLSVLVISPTVFAQSASQSRVQKLARHGLVLAPFRTARVGGMETVRVGERSGFGQEAQASTRRYAALFREISRTGDALVAQGTPAQAGRSLAEQR
ncbi:MAG TPA: hypothetical protein VL588_07155 [Bdellovibrionota bacterium]|nr:hypothetical protein [Bdellovibrionota bacterium]